MVRETKLRVRYSKTDAQNLLAYPLARRQRRVEYRPVDGQAQEAGVAQAAMV